MIVELIAKNAGASQEHRAYYPSPSKVGQCVRALTYHAIGVEGKDFSDRAILIFDDGHFHEKLIKKHIELTSYNLIEFKGKNQRIEIAVIDGIVMDGEIDGLLEDVMLNLRLLEIKSINHFGFQRLEYEPQDSHRRQSNLYMHGLIAAGFDIREALILYKNKNTAAMKDFIIKYDEQLALDDIQMFRDVSAWAKEMKVPPRQYDRNSDWQCGYCRYEKTCYENYQEEFEALESGVELPQELETEFKYYLEVNGHRLENKKEEDTLKVKIKARLKDQGIRAGSCGQYTVELSLTERQMINKDLVTAWVENLLHEVKSDKDFDLEKALLPKNYLPEVMNISNSEKLTIRKIKEIA